MRSLWKHTFVVACSSVMLAAPLPSFAAAPDLYVKIGPIVKETSPLRTVYKVDVTVGNAGNVAPNASVYAFLRVSTASGPVCPELGIPDIQGRLSPGAAFKAFRFQVTYPGPATQLQPGATKKGALKDLQLVGYTIEAEVKYLNYPCSNFESNCLNNYPLPPASRGFLSGGTPSCVKVVQ